MSNDECQESRIAILVPAHNEIDVIDRCLAYSARQAGRQNVYLVDDNSSDGTADAARYWTPNVLSVKRGGKAGAVFAGVRHFRLVDRYDGILILDADSLMVHGALEEYDELLKPGVAAVIGHMRVLSSQKGPIAAWRRHQYFYMPAVYLRGAEAYRGGMPVTPGFCTVYATSAFKHFEHDPKAPTEDIDWCWQIHRKKLGSIRYAPKAYVETAVPINFGDYIKQIIRWDKGWFYATLIKHRAPLGFQPADFVQGLMSLEMFSAWARALALLFLGPLGLLFGLGVKVSGMDVVGLLGLSLIFDAALLAALALVSSLSLMRLGVIGWLPLFPVLYWVDQSVNLYSLLSLRGGLNAQWKSPLRPK